MAEPAERLMTLEEFLAFEGEPDRLYELVAGRLVAMAPAAPNHGRVVMNVGGALGRSVKPPCSVVGNAGIRPPEAHSFFVADIAVTCTKEPPGTAYIVEPRLIVEVYSPSTQAHDRGVKLPAYRDIESVQDILMIASERRRVEHSRREAKGWHVIEHIGDAELTLAATGDTLTLETIYAGVDL